MQMGTLVSPPSSPKRGRPADRPKSRQSTASARSGVSGKSRVRRRRDSATSGTGHAKAPALLASNPVMDALRRRASARLLSKPPVKKDRPGSGKSHVGADGDGADAELLEKEFISTAARLPHLAALVERGSVRRAAALMRAWKIPLDAEISDGRSPLMYVVEQNDSAAAGALLNAGADPNKETSAMTRPLFEALKLRSLSSARVVAVHGGDPNRVTGCGEGALSAAVLGEYMHRQLAEGDEDPMEDVVLDTAVSLGTSINLTGAGVLPAVHMAAFLVRSCAARARACPILCSRACRTCTTCWSGWRCAVPT